MMAEEKKNKKAVQEITADQNKEIKEVKKPVKKVKAPKTEKKKEKKAEKKEKASAIKTSISAGQAWRILRYPHLTEKSVGLVDEKNTLVFVVKENTTKKEIKEAFMAAFQVQVKKVNVLRTQTGEKKAYVSLKEENKALDIATRLGIL